METIKERLSPEERLAWIQEQQRRRQELQKDSGSDKRDVAAIPQEAMSFERQLRREQRARKNKMLEEEALTNPLLAALLRSQRRKYELQEQFDKDCKSGKINELLRNAKPAF